jgi:CubicO group peptidase (beta-lactamase class C family)
MWVEKIKEKWDLPGLSLGVIKGDEVWKLALGNKKVGTQDPIDSGTLFAIASNSKAFTAACISILVDEQKMGWDDKVIQHLPSFSMYDPYVTREVCNLGLPSNGQLTVRDLICHRAGLPLGCGDLMFWPQTDVTADEVIDKIKFLKPTISFRSKFAYDNILYAVAGRIIEVVSGMSWSEFIKKRVFAPLGMKTSNTSPSEFKEGDNVATPHSKYQKNNLQLD